MVPWYKLSHSDLVDSPALLVSPETVRSNIAAALRLADPGRLRPHIKTHKTPAVMRLMREAGIYKIKCATIAEAEMAAQEGVPDILLAYQPTPVKMERLLQLCLKYPATHFSTLVDNRESAAELGRCFSEKGMEISVYPDINIGMNRTGLPVGEAADLWRFCLETPGIHPRGLHAYDGHLRIEDPTERKQSADKTFLPVLELADQIGGNIPLIASGSPTFSAHAMQQRVECSPGTFVFWDWGYSRLLPDLPFQHAAVLMTRVISVLNDELLCLDLGHKSVAAENPVDKRVYFPGEPEARCVSQSEEHLVVWVPDARRYSPGDVWYGIPYHICPTVALYDELYAVQANEPLERWPVIARRRKLEI